MFTEVKSCSEIVVTGLSYRGTNQNGEIPSLWKSFMVRGDEICDKVGSCESYGVMGKHNPETGEFDYIACVEVSGAGTVPVGMRSVTVPAGDYAVFTFPFSRVSDICCYVQKEWLPSSGYQHARTWEFEYYPESFDPADINSEMMLYVPVKKVDGE